jgi:hypothetical protein
LEFWGALGLFNLDDDDCVDGNDVVVDADAESRILLTLENEGTRGFSENTK